MLASLFLRSNAAADKGVALTGRHYGSRDITFFAAAGQVTRSFGHG